MNRTILIVICDFLLVSLLAFSSVDINQAADQSADRKLNVDLATNRPDSGKDLAAAMRLASSGRCFLSQAINGSVPLAATADLRAPTSATTTQN